MLPHLYTPRYRRDFAFTVSSKKSIKPVRKADKTRNGASDHRHEKVKQRNSVPIKKPSSTEQLGPYIEPKSILETRDRVSSRETSTGSGNQSADDRPDSIQRKKLCQGDSRLVEGGKSMTSICEPNVDHLVSSTHSYTPIGGGNQEVDGQTCTKLGRFTCFTYKTDPLIIPKTMATDCDNGIDGLTSDETSNEYDQRECRMHIESPGITLEDQVYDIPHKLDATDGMKTKMGVQETYVDTEPDVSKQTHTQFNIHKTNSVAIEEAKLTHKQIDNNHKKNHSASSGSEKRMVFKRTTSIKSNESKREAIDQDHDSTSFRVNKSVAYFSGSNEDISPRGICTSDVVEASGLDNTCQELSDTPDTGSNETEQKRGKLVEDKGVRCLIKSLTRSRDGRGEFHWTWNSNRPVSNPSDATSSSQYPSLCAQPRFDMLAEQTPTSAQTDAIVSMASGIRPSLDLKIENLKGEKKRTLSASTECRNQRASEKVAITQSLKPKRCDTVQDNSVNNSNRIGFQNSTEELGRSYGSATHQIQSQASTTRKKLLEFFSTEPPLRTDSSSNKAMDCNVDNSSAMEGVQGVLIGTNHTLSPNTFDQELYPSEGVGDISFEPSDTGNNIEQTLNSNAQHNTDDIISRSNKAISPRSIRTSEASRLDNTPNTTIDCNLDNTSAIESVQGVAIGTNHTLSSHTNGQKIYSPEGVGVFLAEPSDTGNNIEQTLNSNAQLNANDIISRARSSVKKSHSTIVNTGRFISHARSGNNPLPDKVSDDPAVIPTQYVKGKTQQKVIGEVENQIGDGQIPVKKWDLSSSTYSNSEEGECHVDGHNFSTNKTVNFNSIESEPLCPTSAPPAHSVNRESEFEDILKELEKNNESVSQKPTDMYRDQKKKSFTISRVADFSTTNPKKQIFLRQTSVDRSLRLSQKFHNMSENFSTIDRLSLKTTKQEYRMFEDDNADCTKMKPLAHPHDTSNGMEQTGDCNVSNPPDGIIVNSTNVSSTGTDVEQDARRKQLSIPTSYAETFSSHRKNANTLLSQAVTVTESSVITTTNHEEQNQIAGEFEITGSGHQCTSDRVVNTLSKQSISDEDQTENRTSIIGTVKSNRTIAIGKRDPSLSTESVRSNEGWEPRVDARRSLTRGKLLNFFSVKPESHMFSNTKVGVSVDIEDNGKNGIEGGGQKELHSLTDLPDTNCQMKQKIDSKLPGAFIGCDVSSTSLYSAQTQSRFDIEDQSPSTTIADLEHLHKHKHIADKSLVETPLFEPSVGVSENSITDSPTLTDQKCNSVQNDDGLHVEIKKSGKLHDMHRDLDKTTGLDVSNGIAGNISSKTCTGDKREQFTTTASSNTSRRLIPTALTAGKVFTHRPQRTCTQSDFILGHQAININKKEFTNSAEKYPNVSIINSDASVSANNKDDASVKDGMPIDLIGSTATDRKMNSTIDANAVRSEDEPPYESQDTIIDPEQTMYSTQKYIIAENITQTKDQPTYEEPQLSVCNQPPTSPAYAKDRSGTISFSEVAVGSKAKTTTNHRTKLQGTVTGLADEIRSSTCETTYTKPDIDISHEESSVTTAETEEFAVNRRTIGGAGFEVDVNRPTVIDRFRGFFTTKSDAEIPTDTTVDISGEGDIPDVGLPSNLIDQKLEYGAESDRVDVDRETSGEFRHINIPLEQSADSNVLAGLAREIRSSTCQITHTKPEIDITHGESSVTTTQTKEFTVNNKTIEGPEVKVHVEKPTVFDKFRDFFTLVSDSKTLTDVNVDVDVAGDIPDVEISSNFTDHRLDCGAEAGGVDVGMKKSDDSRDINSYFEPGVDSNAVIRLADGIRSSTCTKSEIDISHKEPPTTSINTEELTVNNKTTEGPEIKVHVEKPTVIDRLQNFFIMKSDARNPTDATVHVSVERDNPDVEIFSDLTDHTLDYSAKGDGVGAGIETSGGLREMSSHSELGGDSNVENDLIGEIRPSTCETTYTNPETDISHKKSTKSSINTKEFTVNNEIIEGPEIKIHVDKSTVIDKFRDFFTIKSDSKITTDTTVDISGERDIPDVGLPSNLTDQKLEFGAESNRVGVDIETSRHISSPLEMSADSNVLTDLSRETTYTKLGNDITHRGSSVTTTQTKEITVNNETIEGPEVKVHVDKPTVIDKFRDFFTIKSDSKIPTDSTVAVNVDGGRADAGITREVTDTLSTDHAGDIGGILTGSLRSGIVGTQAYIEHEPLNKSIESINSRQLDSAKSRRIVNSTTKSGMPGELIEEHSYTTTQSVDTQYVIGEGVAENPSLNVCESTRAKPEDDIKNQTLPHGTVHTDEFNLNNKKSEADEDNKHDVIERFRNSFTNKSEVNMSPHVTSDVNVKRDIPEIGVSNEVVDQTIDCDSKNNGVDTRVRASDESKLGELPELIMSHQSPSKTSRKIIANSANRDPTFPSNDSGSKKAMGLNIQDTITGVNSQQDTCGQPPSTTTTIMQESTLRGNTDEHAAELSTKTMASRKNITNDLLGTTSGSSSKLKYKDSLKSSKGRKPEVDVRTSTKIGKLRNIFRVKGHDTKMVGNMLETKENTPEQSVDAKRTFSDQTLGNKLDSNRHGDNNFDLNSSIESCKKNNDPDRIHDIHNDGRGKNNTTPHRVAYTGTVQHITSSTNTVTDDLHKMSGSNCSVELTETTKQRAESTCNIPESPEEESNLTTNCGVSEESNISSRGNCDFIDEERYPTEMARFSRSESENGASLTSSTEYLSSNGVESETDKQRSTRMEKIRKFFTVKCCQTTEEDNVRQTSKQKKGTDELNESIDVNPYTNSDKKLGSNKKDPISLRSKTFLDSRCTRSNSEDERNSSIPDITAECDTVSLSRFQRTDAESQLRGREMQESLTSNSSNQCVSDQQSSRKPSEEIMIEATSISQWNKKPAAELNRKGTQQGGDRVPIASCPGPRRVSWSSSLDTDSELPAECPRLDRERCHQDGYAETVSNSSNGRGSVASKIHKRSTYSMLFCFFFFSLILPVDTYMF